MDPPPTGPHPAPASASRRRRDESRSAGRLNLIHCSYHKCLTVYYRRIMDVLVNRCQPWRAGYRHYNSHLLDFYAGFSGDSISSINNRALDLAQLGRFRISRFLRDPRDLVVSGYFYHRRGVEAWTRIEAPTPADWYFANGVVPEGLQREGTCFARYLESLPEEEGLMAEIEFRALHFESMSLWPERHPDILTFRYENVIGHESEVFRQLFDFYGLSWIERRLGIWFAQRYSIGRRLADPHVRDPAVGQWRKHFTPRVRQAFDARYPGLIRQLGYPSD